MQPWWQVATPHEDIREGRFDEAVFAADLGDVLYERGPVDYRDPETFFRKTYFTRGLENLAGTVLHRLMGGGGRAGFPLPSPPYEGGGQGGKGYGEGVIQLQTPFGGGKTHALLLLYHLLRHRERVEPLEPVQRLLRAAGMEALPEARVAAFVGTHQDPQEGQTPWGEIAAQLGGYERVRVHDQQRVSPGKQVLRDLLERHAPALLLVDELLEYVVKAAGVRVGEGTLKGQTLAFLQELTETVAALPNVGLIIALPSSLLERYDEAAEEALAQLQRVTGRVEAIYAPVEGVEIYEIIRKRLFESLGPDATHRRVADEYFHLYQQCGDDLPPEVREVAYRDRMACAYPFHPELIDILFERWGTFASFQRTRGALRLLAMVVADLYQRELPAPLIQPAHLNLEPPGLRREFLKHIGNVYESVLASDIVGDQAKARRIDGEIGTEYRKHRVASSLATAIFFYSHSGGGQRGAGLARLRLAFLREGIPPAIVGDTMQRLEDELWYLHREENRYYFSSEVNLNRALLDKQQAVSEEPEEVFEALKKAVQATAGPPSLRAGRAGEGEPQPYLWPGGSGDLPDNKALKLVLLSPAYTRGAPETEPFLRELFTWHGQGFRTYRNVLVFLLMDGSGYVAVKHAVERLLALQRARADAHLVATLSEADRRELDKRLKDAESGLPFQVLSAYRVLAKGTSQGFDFRDMGMPTVGEKTLSERVKQFLENEEMLLRQISPKYVTERLLGGKDEIGYREMADAFLKSPDFPLLASEEVLQNALTEGVRNKFFGLRLGERLYFGEGLGAGLIGDEARVVNPALAVPLKEEQERQEREREERERSGGYQRTERDAQLDLHPRETGEAFPSSLIPHPSPSSPHQVRIVARLPWDRLSDFVTGVISPLQGAGAEVSLKVELMAQSQEAVGPQILDLQVKETLAQIGAEVEAFEEE